jgi:hypothetical protein
MCCIMQRYNIAFMPCVCVQVLLRARPTVSKSDLDVFERFTSEFGEEAN